MGYKVQGFCTWGDFTEIRLKNEKTHDIRYYLFYHHTCVHAFEDFASAYQWRNIDISSAEEKVLWNRFRISLLYVEPYPKLKYYEYLLIQKGIKEQTVFEVLEDENGFCYIYLENIDITRGFLMEEGDVLLFMDLDRERPRIHPCASKVKLYLKSREIPFEVHIAV